MAKSKVQRFELFHWVHNGGDGSANVRYCVTEEAAREKDAAQDEQYGEPTVGSCTLEYEDGKLYLVGEKYDYSGRTAKLTTFRNEIKEVK